MKLVSRAVPLARLLLVFSLVLVSLGFAHKAMSRRTDDPNMHCVEGFYTMGTYNGDGTCNYIRTHDGEAPATDVMCTDSALHDPTYVTGPANPDHTCPSPGTGSGLTPGGSQTHRKTVICGGGGC